MSESNGSAFLAGNPAGDVAAAGNSSINVTDSNTSYENAPANDTGSWYDKIEDADLKGYVQNKGWKDPTELAHGYKSLEKLLGGEKLPMPKGSEDAEGWSRVFDALGRPKSAEEYGIKTPDGTETDFSKSASGKFYDLGLSADQAKGLTEWWQGQQQSLLDAQGQQSAQATEQEISSLRSEWGGAFEENIELGRRAAREFGLNQESLSKIEQGLGAGEMLKLMSKIGRGLTEHNFETGKSTNSFGMTPQAAQQRINDLRNDSTWSSKYLSGDADAKNELARLMGLAHPE